MSFNTEQTIGLAKQASAKKALFALFPELGLSAYSNEDLFHQEALLKRVQEALGLVLEKTKNLNTILVVGAPLRVDSFLFNGGVVMYRGRILGVALKSYLPNYREYYERQAVPPGRGRPVEDDHASADRKISPSGRICFSRWKTSRGFTFYIEICEDLWVPVPPSSFAALAGATVLANLSASNITIGKSEYRHSLAANQSARCVAAYLYAAAGPGESTTDLAWDGQAMVYENGTLLAESERFARKAQMILADIDLDRLVQDRMRLTSFSQNARILRDRIDRFRKITFPVEIPQGRIPLAREYARFPYVPADPASARRALLRGLQHPGPGAGQAPEGLGNQERRHRGFRRPGLHPRPHRRGPDDGSAGLPPLQREGLHHAGICHDGQDLPERPPA